MIMDKWQIDECLNSMIVLVDSREQDTDRAKKRYAAIDRPIKRCKLDYGDYAYNFVMPGQEWLYDTTDNVRPHIVIERKMNLDELAQCFTHDRQRFEREFERAKAAGGRIILLVENASWELLINGKYRSRFSPDAFLASITAYMVRYDMGIIMCKEETTGRLIREIFYRDLKEKLERKDGKEE